MPETPVHLGRYLPKKRSKLSLVERAYSEESPHPDQSSNAAETTTMGSPSAQFNLSDLGAKPPGYPAPPARTSVAPNTEDHNTSHQSAHEPSASDISHASTTFGSSNGVETQAMRSPSADSIQSGLLAERLRSPNPSAPHETDAGGRVRRSSVESTESIGSGTPGEGADRELYCRMAQGWRRKLWTYWSADRKCNKISRV